MIETPTQQADKFVGAFVYDESSANLPAPQASVTALMLSGNGMERAFRFAEMMARGMVAVPQHLRGNPADCLAVVMQAMQWDMNPYTVAQKSHVTKGGQLAFDGQLIASVVIARAPVLSLPRYEHHGDWSKVRGKFQKVKGNNGEYLAPTYKPEDEAGLFVRVIAHLKGEEEPRTMDVYMDQCQPRFSTMWASDPEQQICYAAIRKWARRNTPNVILGVYADDEMEPNAPRDMGRADVVGTPSASAAPAQEHPKQAAADAAASKGVAAYSEFWSDKVTTKEERFQLAPGHIARKERAFAADKNRTVDTPAAAPAASPAASPAAAATDAPIINREHVEGLMKAARDKKDQNALDEAANLIGAVPSEDDQTDLGALYEAFTGEISE
jgi:hypothetical protein